ncbi:hypothetical protein AABM26_10030 [Curtobacterium aetherium]|uniref:hypothetical protein n=1 Tax=Curtobacterium aetherium TaxID=2841594 RepID=UPI003B51D364
MTVDEDGRSFTGGRMQWWVAEFRVPTEGYSSHCVVIGRCTAYTLYAPDSFDTVMGNFDVFQFLGDYRSALPIHHPAGGSFWELFELRDDTGDVSLYERIALRDEPRDVLRLTLSPTWTAVVRQAEILSPWQAASVLGWMMPCHAPLLDDYWSSEQALDFWQDVRAGRRRPRV